jgi:CPA2 family monovalent cation:H+ antiporter-2
MGHIAILPELAVIAVTAVFVALALRRLALPTAAGLLLSGALVGPAGLGLVKDLHAIEVIAEVGVVMLLFTIGLEFSLARLSHIFRHVALGGLLQVFGTIGVVAGAVVLFGQPLPQAIFFGFVVALSSTAVVLRALGERRELDAPHGRFIVGVLIFQDLCVIPMVLLVPLLGADGGSGNAVVEVGIALGRAALVVGLVLVLARYLVPKLLDQVEANKSREVFLLAVLAICIGTAWLTSLAGLSLALGAFLGGLVVADTEHSHRALGDILPLRDVFVSVFFVSLGMFFDVRVVAEHPGLVFMLLVGFICGKGTLATIAALLMRFPPRAAWLAGVGLAQFGEFGFVLVKLGTTSGVVTDGEIAPLLNAGIVSMFLTPLLVHHAPRLRAGERLVAPLARLLRVRAIEEEDTPEKALSGHVVVIGYGIAGRMIAGSLRKLGTELQILELNAENVRQGRALGDPVFYADATSPEALGHAHIEQAAAVIVLINDKMATIRVIDSVHRAAPTVPIFSRTHYLSEVSSLADVGASEVIVEEVEAAMETLARVLRLLEVPRNLIDEQINVARTESGGSARSLTVPRNQLSAHGHLAELKVENVQVTEASGAVTRSARELNLRYVTGGAVIVAVRRGEQLLTEGASELPLAADDIVYLIGNIDATQSAVELLAGRASGGAV